MHDQIQALKAFVLDKGLPLTDIALFGLKCPYCGKSDRIRTLENPVQLQGLLSEEEIVQYKRLWAETVPDNKDIGVCKFCHNLLSILSRQRRAEPL